MELLSQWKLEVSLIPKFVHFHSQGSVLHNVLVEKCLRVGI